MIKVSELVKRYGSKVAVDNVSFSINKGDIVGFLGPNGAGKSTIMNIITGYIAATEGSIQINGIDLLEDPINAHKKIGYLPEQPPLYVNMKVKKYLDFVYRLKKVKKSKDDHINSICEMVGISDVMNRLIRNLSKGYKQRVGLAQALIGDPEILILDEPTVGLDPLQIIEIRNLIRQLGKSRTIILSSHILSEIQAIADRVLVLNHGKIIADDSPKNLTSKISGGNRVMLTTQGDFETLSSVLHSIEGVKSIKKHQGQQDGLCDFEIQIEKDNNTRGKIVETLTSHGYPLISFKELEVNLEEIFLDLITKDKDIDEHIDTNQGATSVQTNK